MDEHEQTDADNTTIPEEEASEQRLIKFKGDELPAAMSPSGIIYISLPGICKAFGLAVQPQMLRIRRTATLAKGLRRISLTTRGGFQRTNCLRLDKIGLWLAGIETARMKNDDFRAKIDAYQEELAPVAMQVFMQVMGIRTAEILPTQDPQIIALADRVDALTEITSILREYMESLLEAQGHTSIQLEQAIHLLEALTSRQDTTETQVAKIDERTQRLTSAHGRDVQELADKIANKIQQQTRSISTQMAHSMVYGRLKTHFRARTYIEIPDERFGEVMSYLHEMLRKVSGGDLPEQGSLF